MAGEEGKEQEVFIEKIAESGELHLQLELSDS